MKKGLFIFLILCFSLTIISCGEDKEESTTEESTTEESTTDTTAPVIAEVTAVTTIYSATNDSTPDYTFSSDEAGTITYGGSCSSSTTSAISGNNTITLVSLNDGTYSDCTIIVTDSSGNVNNTLTITYFIVDTTAATLAEVTAVTTPNNDSTPDYTFSSDEAGAITYGDSCSSSTTDISEGNHTITFNALSNGTYSDCTIIVTDQVGNVSNTLEITSFTVDTSLSVFVGIGGSGKWGPGRIVKSTDNGSSFSTVTSPTSNYLYGVGFGNNTFVAVGLKGTIVRSTEDGSSFSTVTSPTSNRLNGVGFGNNTFVAVGTSGNIVRSTDKGSSFSTVTPPTEYNLYGVGFGNNTFVVMGWSGKIVKSTDYGSSFSTVTSPTSKDLRGVGFGNNTFVGVGESGTIVRSTNNGSSFSTVTSPTSKDLRGVGFGNNTFVAVGEKGTIVRSTDNGSTWNNATSSTSYGYYAVGFPE